MDKRLLRINVLIFVITVVFSLTALLLNIKMIGFLGVAVGGLSAFTYFLLLTIFVSKAFLGGGEDGIEPKEAGKLSLKLLLLTIGLAVFTIAVILTGICRPFGFLLGFSTLFGAIAFETMAFLVFSKPQKESSSEN
ncbi:MAG: hypothetical protein J7M09_06640 [Deltaproteobacteria bacterium]|nr:hypothetical protein [Candidatus Tharpella sp.]